MDMCLAEVIRHKATGETRPRMDRVAAWLAARCDPADRVEACVFANVGSGHEEPLARWVANLRDWGWSIFVKPKNRPRDDIDAEMIRYIERPFRQGSLVELIVASHDARAFASPLARYSQAGVHVIVLGYRERERVASSNPDIDFVDLEDLPGAFLAPLPRTNLFDLPPGGRWFAPFARILPEADINAATVATAPGAPDVRPAGSPGPEVQRDAPPARTLVTAATSPAPQPLASAAAQMAVVPDEPVEGPSPTTAVPADRTLVESLESEAAIPTADPAPVTEVMTSEPSGSQDAEAPAAEVEPEPTRGDVLAFLIEETFAAAGQSLSLAEAAGLLRTRYPGFSLMLSGYSSVADLLDELQASGQIEVARLADGHRLLARPVQPTGTRSVEIEAESDPGPDAPDAEPTPPTRDPEAASDQVIDLTATGAPAPEPAAATAPGSTPPAFPAPEPPASGEPVIDVRASDRPEVGGTIEASAATERPAAGLAASGGALADHPIYRAFRRDPDQGH